MEWSNTPELFCNKIMTVMVKPSYLFAKQGNGAVRWLDDILLYVTSFVELFNAYEKSCKPSIEKK